MLAVILTNKKIKKIKIEQWTEAVNTLRGKWPTSWISK